MQPSSKKYFHLLINTLILVLGEQLLGLKLLSKSNVNMQFLLDNSSPLLPNQLFKKKFRRDLLAGAAFAGGRGGQLPTPGCH